MRAPPRTLYWQIAGLYLMLLLAFSLIAIVLALREFDGFLGEVEQRLNRDLASQLVRDLTPALASTPGTSLNEAAKHIADINPSIDIYVLDRNGRVRSSLTGKAAVRSQVELSRLHQFMAKDAPLPIRATDPGFAQGERVFSSAVLPPSVGGGFLYVVLPGMPFETTAHMVRTSYIVRGTAVVLGSVFITTVIAGLAFFFILTRRFQRLTLSVKRFQEGAFDERAETQPQDQIGRLASSFNEMAATIELQFQAIRSTDEARRAFASNISHDFRTPLTALRGYADRLLRERDRLTPEETRQNLEAVVHSTAQLEHLADQLATMVHLDGEQDSALRMESFSIAELAQDSIIKFKPSAEERGICLSLRNPEQVPLVLGNIALIERVLANLMANAIYSTARGGSVLINLPVVEQCVIVQIKDTGCGIAPEELPFVKQRFYRTQISRAEGRPGTGLGLAIVDEMLTKHGSVLSIESKVGIGTTTTFYLQIA